MKSLGKKGHHVVALHRATAQSNELKESGAEPFLGDLIDLETPQLARAMAGSEVVIFTAGAAGAGIELTNAIDGKGLESSVAAAELAGTRRFLLVSAFPEALRDTETSAGFKNYMRVKKEAEVFLASSELDWVILRPGTLVDGAGTGRVRAGQAIPYGEISRHDVAGFLAAMVERPKISRQIIELTQGETLIDLAVNNFSSR